MIRITITDGAIRKKPPAKRKFSGAPSRRESTSAGSVRWRSVRSEDAKTSFQETMKTKIADAASPGSASGSATFTNAFARLQPSEGVREGCTPARAARTRRVGDLRLHRLLERGLRVLAPHAAPSHAAGRGALPSRRRSAELPFCRRLLPDGAVGDRDPDHSPLPVHDVGSGVEVMADVKFQTISKTFGKFTAVDDVDLEVADGDFIVLLGPSGCGKTTLLRCLAGLEKVDGGRVFIGGRDATDLPA